MTDTLTDPPMTPQDGTTVWFETPPAAIINDPELAVLMVRVGMAANALNAQLDAVRHSATEPGARRTRNILAALVNSAANINESLRLTRENMAALRSLAQRTHAKPELFDRIGKLCAGKHPASQTLKLARNKLGSHWDADVIAASLKEYERNEILVWIESDGDGHPVYRLASDVLVHALLPTNEIETEAQQQELTTALENVSKAMNIVIEFFTACTYGYFRVCSAVRHERPPDDAAPHKPGGD